MRKRGRFEAAPTARPARKKVNAHLQMMVTSAVSMVLCCSMLLGTTMAWFTDTITSAANQITIGTLKVDLLYNGASLKNTSLPIFGESKVRSGETTVWIPESFEYRELTVVNEGNIPVNYSLNFLTGETDLEAAKYFSVYVKEGKVDAEKKLEIETILEKKDGWEKIDGSLFEILQKKTAVFTGSLDVASDGGKTQNTYTIALCMDADSSSDIQGKIFSLNIQLHAYQSNAKDIETPTDVPEASKPEGDDIESQSEEDTQQNKPSTDTEQQKSQLTNTSTDTDQNDQIKDDDQETKQDDQAKEGQQESEQGDQVKEGQQESEQGDQAKEGQQESEQGDQVKDGQQESEQGDQVKDGQQEPVLDGQSDNGDQQDSGLSGQSDNGDQQDPEPDDPSTGE